MEIYQHRIYFCKFPNFIWRREEKFFLRLVGINVSRNNKALVVEPVYSPILAARVIGKITFIELSWDNPAALLMLFPWWPFLYFERVNLADIQEIQKEK